MSRASHGETVRKVTISLPEDLLAFTDWKASAEGMSRSRVIAGALESERAREMTALAAEGYQFYSAEAKIFASSSIKPVSEALADDAQTG